MLLNIQHNPGDDSHRARSVVHVDAFSGEDLEPLESISLAALSAQLVVGDVVFIHVKALPFLKVAQTTGSWTNHVGIVVDTHETEPTIAESAFPIAKTTSLSRFVARSAQRRVAVQRLHNRPTLEQQSAIRQAAQERLGIIYDTGFNLHSRRQFCSRFVREVLMDATGNEVGEVERFTDFLNSNPQVDLVFWRLWYFGKIPWQRQTVTPASLLKSPALLSVFNGYVERNRPFSSFLHPH